MFWVKDGGDAACEASAEGARMLEHQAAVRCRPAHHHEAPAERSEAESLPVLACPVLEHLVHRARALRHVLAFFFCGPMHENE